MSFLCNNLMFVQCIIRRSRNNQHNAQICTIALFYMLAPTCFGSSLPSSGSFWVRLSYVKIQIDMVVKWPVGRGVVVVCCASQLNKAVVQICALCLLFYYFFVIPDIPNLLTSNDNVESSLDIAEWLKY
jgi:hypothetical protein